jgi:hypothetical protein
LQQLRIGTGLLAVDFEGRELAQFKEFEGNALNVGASWGSLVADVGTGVAERGVAAGPRVFGSHFPPPWYCMKERYQWIRHRAQ